MKSIAWTLLLFSALAFAQDPKDAAKPSDGAIKGGSVLPGETSGTSDGRPSARGAERCKELSGTLREQCLEQERKSSAGATRSPGEPPPQNPRLTEERLIEKQ